MVKPELYVKNLQRSRPINPQHLCRIIRSLLRENLDRENYILAVYLVGDRRITELNETHLHHAGPTDVIAFDYTNNNPSSPSPPLEERAGERRPSLLIGDIFICVEEAIRQAAKYRTSWQSEVIRYIVHGLLHLCGHDDQTTPARKKMKLEESRILRALSIRFSFTRLGR
jgi:probable rRNA maturation factor